MPKSLLLITVVVLGLIVLASTGQVGAQQAEFENLRSQVVQFQQQNQTLAAQQEQIQSEKEHLLAQNGRMQQDLTTVQVAYQQLDAQNQSLQTEIAAAVQAANETPSSAFWVSLVGLLVVSAVFAATLVIVWSTHPTPAQSSRELSSDMQLEQAEADDPWASRDYRDQAIRKARLIEQWERRSILTNRNSPSVLFAINQKTTRPSVVDVLE